MLVNWSDRRGNGESGTEVKDLALYPLDISMYAYMCLFLHLYLFVFMCVDVGLASYRIWYDIETERE